MLIFSAHVMSTSFAGGRLGALDVTEAWVGFGAAELGIKEGLGAGDEVRAGERREALDEPGANVGFGAAELGTKEGLGGGDEVRAGGRLGDLDELGVGPSE